jgi:cytochrome P450
MTQVLQTVDESLYANLDVGIGSVSWNLVFLACYPEVQEELVREIQDETARQGWEAYVQRSDTLLEACICESLRLRPIAGERFALMCHSPSADKTLQHSQFLKVHRLTELPMAMSYQLE